MDVKGCSVPFPCPCHQREQHVYGSSTDVGLCCPIFSAPTPSARPGCPRETINVRFWTILAFCSGGRSRPTLHGEETWLFQNAPFAWPQQQKGSSGTVPKSEGILPLHIPVWTLNVMKPRMTKLVSWGYFLRMLPAFPWVKMLPWVCVILVLRGATSVLLTVKRHIFWAYHNSPATNREFW